jgi:hypothetical protein
VRADLAHPTPPAGERVAVDWRNLAQRAWSLLDVECPNAEITNELFAVLASQTPGGGA